MYLSVNFISTHIYTEVSWPCHVTPQKIDMNKLLLLTRISLVVTSPGHTCGSSLQTNPSPGKYFPVVTPPLTTPSSRLYINPIQVHRSHEVRTGQRQDSYTPFRHHISSSPATPTSSAYTNVRVINWTLDGCVSVSIRVGLTEHYTLTIGIYVSQYVSASVLD